MLVRKRIAVKIQKLLALLLITAALGALLNACTSQSPPPVPDIQSPDTLNPETTGVLPAGSGMTQCASNDNLALYFDPDDGEFIVENRKNGRLWYSNPEGKEDSDLRGSPKYSMFSQLYIETFQPGMAINGFVSHTASVQQGGLTVELIPNGVRALYYFPSELMTIPLDLILFEDKLLVQFDINSIIPDPECRRRLMSISLAPVFGSGTESDDGFLFVPDGSGAVINFNNQKADVAPYREPVYGRDPAMYGIFRPPVTNQVLLPVFGIENNGESVLAVISQGAAASSVRALTAGQFNSVNHVFAHFDLYAFDTVTIGQVGSANAQSTVKYNLADPLAEVCAVSYYFLDETGYVSMALKYGELLRNGADAADIKKAPFYISVFGGMRKRQPVLGFQSNVNVAMTTFADTREIITELKENGAEDIVLVLTHWSSDELRGRMQNRLRPSYFLGGKSGLNELLDYAGSVGAETYLAYDPLSVSSRGRGFWPLFNAARAMDGNYLKVFPYSLSTLLMEINYDPMIYPDMGFLLSNTDTFTESVAGLESGGIVGVYYPQLAQRLYGNYSSNDFMPRLMVERYITTGIFNSTEGYVASNANAYAINGAAHILEAPMVSSNQDITDYSVPFYAIAVGGIAPYSVPAVNNSANPEAALLKAVETGAGLYFNWVYNDPSLFIHSDYEYLFSTGYKRWKDTAIQMYKEHSEAFEEIGSSVLVGHERVSDVLVISTFANGNRVAVNYGYEDSMIEGSLVEARGWAVLGQN